MKRIALQIPILLFALLYYRVYNPDEECFGLVHLIINIAFGVFFLLALAASLYALFKPASGRRTRVVAYLLFFVAIGGIVYNLTLRGHRSGDTWLLAERDAKGGKQILTLRKNGNFTIASNGTDFGCAFSGTYTTIGGSILLDAQTVAKMGEGVAGNYRLNGNVLASSSNSREAAFIIVQDRLP